MTAGHQGCVHVAPGLCIQTLLLCRTVLYAATEKLLLTRVWGVQVLWQVTGMGLAASFLGSIDNTMQQN
jgi:hypothetical protein